jgi:hypothetical protein
MYSKEIYMYYVRGFFHTYFDYLFYKIYSLHFSDFTLVKIISL